MLDKLRKLLRRTAKPVDCLPDGYYPVTGLFLRVQNGVGAHLILGLQPYDGKGWARPDDALDQLMIPLRHGAFVVQSPEKV